MVSSDKFKLKFDLHLFYLCRNPYLLQSKIKKSYFLGCMNVNFGNKAKRENGLRLDLRSAKFITNFAFSLIYY